MQQRLEPEQMRSISASAGHSWLIGTAASAFHQIRRAISQGIPDNVYTRVVGELIAGSFSGAVPFAAVAPVRDLSQKWSKPPNDLLNPALHDHNDPAGGHKVGGAAYSSVRQVFLRCRPISRSAP